MTQKKTKDLIPTPEQIAFLKKRCAMNMYAESSMNMITLMSIYAAQSGITEMFGKISLDKQMFRFRIKQLSKEIWDKVRGTVRQIINVGRKEQQAEYLFTYGDAIDDVMRPLITAIHDEMQRMLDEKGCKKSDACAWVLTARGLICESCSVYNAVTAELNDMFKVDFSNKFSLYNISGCLQLMDTLLSELEKTYPELKRLDAQKIPQTAVLFEKIDQIIHDTEVLMAAANDAEKCLDQEKLEERQRISQDILSQIREEIDEHQKKYL